MLDKTLKTLFQFLCPSIMWEIIWSVRDSGQCKWIQTRPKFKLKRRRVSRSAWNWRQRSAILKWDIILLALWRPPVSDFKILILSRDIILLTLLRPPILHTIQSWHAWQFKQGYFHPFIILPAWFVDINDYKECDAFIFRMFVSRLLIRPLT